MSSELDRMTVGELRDLLALENQDALVLVDGYEGGFTKPIIRTQWVKRGEWGSYCGPYDAARPEDDGEPVVLVSRTEGW